MSYAERTRREQEARQTKFFAVVCGVYVLLVFLFVGGAWYLGS